MIVRAWFRSRSCWCLFSGRMVFAEGHEARQTWATFERVDWFQLVAFSWLIHFLAVLQHSRLEKLVFNGFSGPRTDANQPNWLTPLRAILNLAFKLGRTYCTVKVCILCVWISLCCESCGSYPVKWGHRENTVEHFISGLLGLVYSK